MVPLGVICDLTLQYNKLKTPEKAIIGLFRGFVLTKNNFN